MIWPTTNIHPGGVIPSWANFTARSGKHKAIDIGHRYGAGKVRWTGDMKAGGMAIWITHAGGFETRYLHLIPSSRVVRRGDNVIAGQPIAQVGHSGLERVAAYATSAAKLKSASHLHFEVLQDGKRVDPELHLGGGAVIMLAAVGALVLFAVYGG